MNYNQGKQINTNDIINYIETNIKFISQPQFIQLNDNDTKQEDELVSLVYKETKELLNLPTNLNSIFNSMLIFRTGVISNINIPSNTDITYISSILSLLDPECDDMKETTQIKFVETFIRKMYKESRDQYDIFGYKELGWTKKDFRNNLRQFKMGRDIMKYVADYLHINIFLLDIENDTLVYVGDRIYTKYKKNIFLLKIDETSFEPLQIGDNSIVEHNTPLINKILNSRFLVERMDCDLTHDEEFNFIVGVEDISKYIDGELKEDIEEPEVGLSEEMNGFEEEDEECNKNYDIADGVTEIDQFTEDHDDNDIEDEVKVDSSYTVAKLKEIAKSKGIVLSYKKDGKNRGKTKGMLIEEINSM